MRRERHEDIEAGRAARPGVTHPRALVDPRRDPRADRDLAGEVLGGHADRPTNFASAAGALGRAIK